MQIPLRGTIPYSLDNARLRFSFTKINFFLLNALLRKIHAWEKAENHSPCMWYVIVFNCSYNELTHYFMSQKNKVIEVKLVWETDFHFPRKEFVHIVQHVGFITRFSTGVLLICPINLLRDKLWHIVSHQDLEAQVNRYVGRTELVSFVCGSRMDNCYVHVLFHNYR